MNEAQEYPRDPGSLGRMAIILCATVCGMVPAAIVVAVMRLIYVSTSGDMPKAGGFVAIFFFFVGALVGYFNIAHPIARRAGWIWPIIVLCALAVLTAVAVAWAWYGADTALGMLVFLVAIVVLGWFVFGGPTGLQPHESIERGVYKNTRLGFTIALPGPDFKFVIRGGGLDSMGAATVAAIASHPIAEGGVWTFVTVNELSNATLESYAALAEPDMPAKELVHKESTVVAGRARETREWRQSAAGEKNRIVLQTLAERDSTKFQVSSVWPASKDSEELRRTVNFIHSSFKLTDDEVNGGGGRVPT